MDYRTEEKWALASAAILIASIAGWILNVIKLIGMLDGPVTGMLIARAAGTLIAPLGVILGYL